eukprot:1978630-Rhodomonas_salina.6
MLRLRGSLTFGFLSVTWASISGILAGRLWLQLECCDPAWWRDQGCVFQARNRRVHQRNAESIVWTKSSSYSCRVARLEYTLVALSASRYGLVVTVVTSGGCNLVVTVRGTAREMRRGGHDAWLYYSAGAGHTSFHSSRTGPGEWPVNGRLRLPRGCGGER